MTEESPQLSRIELLVLARLSGGKKPPSPSEVAKGLARLVTPAASRSAWRERLGPVLRTLEDRGLIDRRRRLTERGKSALRDALGARRTPTWREVRDQVLPALALGGDPKTTGGAARLQSAVLTRLLGLDGQATVTQVLDALVAAELGLPPGKVTLGKIRAVVLAQRAGVANRGDAEAMAKQLAATSLRAPRSDAAQLRLALVRRWLADGAGSVPALAGDATARPPSEPATPPGATGEPPTETPAVSSPAASRAPGVALDDDAFAAMVNDAIRAIGSDGRYGPHKVFVSAIWHQLAGDPRCVGMSVDELKRRLLDAHRNDLLSLARADLVGAMDRDAVSASEIRDRGASFHFVLDPQRLP